MDKARIVKNLFELCYNYTDCIDLTHKKKYDEVDTILSKNVGILKEILEDLKNDT